MTKKLIDEIDKNYPDDIINYFYDYGLDFLYDLWYQEKKNILMVDQTPEAIKKNKESCYITLIYFYKTIFYLLIDFLKNLQFFYKNNNGFFLVISNFLSLSNSSYLLFIVIFF